MSNFTAYTYNADGIRTGKTVNGIKHDYILNGSQILAEKWTQNNVEYVLVYIYDETGAPIGLKYRTSNYANGVFDSFFFEKNLQGDIVAIYNSTGEKIGIYAYTAFGEMVVTTVSGNTTLENNVVNNYNPFRYRGYYYDVETGWYYLQSRYYNPVWGRFLNADGGLYNHMLGYNLFTYCYNNPINYVDYYGDNGVAVLEWIIETLPAIDGPLPIGDVIAVMVGGVLIYIAVDSSIMVDDSQSTILDHMMDINNNTEIFISQPVDSVITQESIDSRDSVSQIKPKDYDPNPHARPNQKKQGRENGNKARKSPKWEPRNNRRDGQPAKPKKHTPGRDHRKYHSIIVSDQIFIFE